MTAVLWLARPNAQLGIPLPPAARAAAPPAGGAQSDQLNELQAEVQSVGAELLYIPQYCPRANAIEGGFSQVNKELEADIVLADRDPERALDEAFQRVGPRYGAAFARRSVKDVRKWL